MGLRELMTIPVLKKKGGKKMKKVKISVICFLVLFLALTTMTPATWAQEKLTYEEFSKRKAWFDDPRPYLTDFYKRFVSPELYSKLTYDVEEMKKLWAECVGFRAPDVVGKIALEIKPGTYSYKDKEKYPFKELMIPRHYDRFKPGGPPHAGNFPEIKVIPTRQYYWALPIAKATKENVGRTKLDNQGYLINDSYVAGYPFPRPEGKFKAQQIMYNWEKRYSNFETNFTWQKSKGFTGGLKEDFNTELDSLGMRLHGRVCMEPYGWLDDRAKKEGEKQVSLIKFYSPRDMYGMVIGISYYLNADHFDQNLMYINALRRVRKMSATDTQDAIAGQDVIYEDQDGFSQKLSPKRYPYKFEVIGEREYLIPAYTLDGSVYYSSKGLELRNIEFERRPLYVVKLTQLDKNYVYSSRTIYIDKETFMLVQAENYDQKGRLYRTAEVTFAFVPEMGMTVMFGGLLADHIDKHSAIPLLFVQPAPFLTRENFDFGALFSKGK
jgi:hypothetical protein